jgi:hypothetical protein
VADVYAFYNTPSEATLYNPGWLTNLSGTVTKRAGVATLSITMERSDYPIPPGEGLAALPMGYRTISDLSIPAIAHSKSAGVVTAGIVIESSTGYIKLNADTTQLDLDIIFVNVTYLVQQI